MDKVLKRKWVKALRSGQYPQGQHMLRNWSNCYCPLGVLCDVMDPSKWVKSVTGYNYLDARGTIYSLLAETVSADGVRDVIRLSDWSEKNFDYIAKYIDTHL